ncbi:MAG: hypothetical protein KDK51_07945 [Deltaproteobacteria bacterium]|nr:hypothetical protein [Deltaproteobacteria bacterium]
MKRILFLHVSTYCVFALLVLGATRSFASTYTLVFVADQAIQSKLPTIASKNMQSIVTDTVTSINELWDQTDITFTHRYQSRQAWQVDEEPIVSIKNLAQQRQNKTNEIVIALSGNYFGANAEHAGVSLHMLPVVLATPETCSSDGKFYTQSLANVLAHELAHVFGAGHRNDPKVMMARAVGNKCGGKSFAFTDASIDFLKKHSQTDFAKFTADQFTAQLFADFNEAKFQRDPGKNYHPFFDTFNYLFSTIDSIAKAESLDRAAGVWQQAYLPFEACYTAIFAGKYYFELGQSGRGLAVFSLYKQTCEQFDYFMAYYHFRYAESYYVSKSYDDAATHINSAMFFLKKHYPNLQNGTGLGMQELQTFMQLQKDILSARDKD